MSLCTPIIKPHEMYPRHKDKVSKQQVGSGEGGNHLLWSICRSAEAAILIITPSTTVNTYTPN